MEICEFVSAFNFFEFNEIYFLLPLEVAVWDSHDFGIQWKFSDAVGFDLRVSKIENYGS